MPKYSHIHFPPEVRRKSSAKHRDSVYKAIQEAAASRHPRKSLWEHDLEHSPFEVEKAHTDLEHKVARKSYGVKYEAPLPSYKIPGPSMVAAHLDHGIPSKIPRKSLAQNPQAHTATFRHSVAHHSDNGHSKLSQENIETDKQINQTDPPSDVHQQPFFLGLDSEPPSGRRSVANQLEGYHTSVLESVRQSLMNQGHPLQPISNPVSQTHSPVAISPSRQYLINQKPLAQSVAAAPISEQMAPPLTYDSRHPPHDDIQNRPGLVSSHKDEALSEMMQSLPPQNNGGSTGPGNVENKIPAAGMKKFSRAAATTRAIIRTLPHPQPQPWFQNIQDQNKNLPSQNEALSEEIQSLPPQNVLHSDGGSMGPENIEKKIPTVGTKKFSHAAAATRAVIRSLPPNVQPRSQSIYDQNTKMIHSLPPQNISHSDGGSTGPGNVENKIPAAGMKKFSSAAAATRAVIRTLPHPQLQPWSQNSHDQNKGHIHTPQQNQAYPSFQFLYPSSNTRTVATNVIPGDIYTFQHSVVTQTRASDFSMLPPSAPPVHSQIPHTQQQAPESQHHHNNHISVNQYHGPAIPYQAPHNQHQTPSFQHQLPNHHHDPQNHYQTPTTHQAPSAEQPVMEHPQIPYPKQRQASLEVPLTPHLFEELPHHEIPPSKQRQASLDMHTPPQLYEEPPPTIHVPPNTTHAQIPASVKIPHGNVPTTQDTPHDNITITSQPPQTNSETIHSPTQGKNRNKGQARMNQGKKRSIFNPMGNADISTYSKVNRPSVQHGQSAGQSVQTPIQNGQAPTNHKIQTPKETTGPPHQTRAPGARPPSVICYICGREYGTASIEIHEKQCIAKWRTENSQLPKHLQRPEPVKPAAVAELQQEIHGSKTGTYNVDAANEQAFESMQQQYMACKKCGRTFFPDRLALHEPQCRGAREGPKPAIGFSRPGMMAPSAFGSRTGARPVAIGASTSARAPGMGPRSSVKPHA